MNYIYEKELWNGYEVAPVILVKKGEILNAKSGGINMIRAGAYAIGVDGLDKKWYAQKISMPKNFNIPDVYRLSPLTPGLLETWNPLGNFALKDSKIRLGDSNHVFFVKYNSDNIGCDKLNKEIICFLVHEGFHFMVQKDRPEGNPDSYVSTEKQYQLLRKQYIALDHIIETMKKNGSYDEMTAAIKEYVEASEDRRSENPEEFYQEVLNETLEGCAQYVEYNAAGTINNKEALDYTDEYITAIRTATGKAGFAGILDYCWENELYNELKWIRYETGAVLCEVLEKYSRCDWQERLNKRQKLTLYELIKEWS